MKKTFITAFFLTFILANSAYSRPVLEYIIDGYPSVEGDCTAQAQNLAAKMQPAFGIKIFDFRCISGLGNGSDKIMIQYVSSNGFPIDGMRIESDHASAEYADYESCRTDLNHQVSLFKKYSGLNPLLSFCSSEREPKLKIYFHGRPVMNRYALNVSLGGFKTIPLIEDAATLEKQVLDSALLAGIKISRIRIDTRYGARLAVYYYAKSQLPLGVFSGISYRDLDECEAESEEYQAMMKALGVRSLTEFCAASLTSPDAAITRYLVGIQSPHGRTWLGEIEFEMTPAFIYSDLSECKNNLQNALSQFSQTTGMKSFGAICGLKSIEPIQYQVHIFH